MSDDMVVLPGERCRKAREAQGMTQAQAAQRLHLSLTYLQSLDADDYERLPEATFVKGYLRNYARLLGLPADEIANTFQQMVNDDVLDKPLQLPSIAPPPSAWRKPVLIALALAVLVALLWALWPASGELPALPEKTPATEQESAQENMNDNVGAQPSGGAVDGFDGMGSGAAPAGADLDGEGITGDGMQDDETDAGAASDSQADGSQAEQADDGSSMLAANGLDRLLLSFTSNCWIKVTDATGRTLRQGEQSGGASLMLDGKAPFSLTLGNAGAVDELLVNGSAVTLPTDSPGKVVRISAP
ncbi:RodZ domain-containing protein [Alcanivorax sp.]|jgi:cytoskeleton protein RodZ|uniref:RodZ domain-containing protein n=1 Tax=Alcanivorax sp. TaxID=1872427 RepID=UPI002B278670|nr:RodZ domain-containing protein [Alcanivorax sp.]